MTRARESNPLFCSQRTKMAADVTPPHLRLDDEPPSLTCANACRRSPSGPSSAITDDVPSYPDALSGPMGETIRTAVQLALGGFISWPSRSEGVQAQTPTGAGRRRRLPARPRRGAQRPLGRRAALGVPGRGAGRPGGSCQLDRGAQRASTPTRWPGSPSWSSPTSTQLSAASVAGHTDELETTGRVRQRLLERLAARLLDGSPAEAVAAAAERADWTPPKHADRGDRGGVQVRAVLAGVPAETLQARETLPFRGRRRRRRAAGAGRARRGPPLAAAHARGPRRRRRPGPAVGAGARVLRAGRARTPPRARHRQRGAPGRRWCSAPTRARCADLRARALAPLDELRDSSAEKLTETLRSWLLHHGRRDAVAAELFVHPQTVRYRMGQLREVFGDALEDPAPDPRADDRAGRCAALGARVTRCSPRAQGVRTLFSVDNPA